MGMSLANCEMPKFTKKARRFHNRDILKKFVDSGEVCCELVGWAHKNEHVCAQSMTYSAKRCGYHHVVVRAKGGKVYLVNSLLLDNDG